MADKLSRSKEGSGWSFGGGNHNYKTKTSKIPVILVHGAEGKAKTLLDVRNHFFKNHYADSEVYSTTWGDGGKTKSFSVTMKCSYVKHVRNMIKAVSAYTRSPVKIVAYSMGSAIARKAIIGGRCKDDSSQNLGGSLKKTIRSFISVAGVGYGSYLCGMPGSFLSPACNTNNGIRCGSKFLNDINSNSNYRKVSNTIVSIYSKKDNVIGYKVCNASKSSGYVRGSKYTAVYSKKDHQQTMHGTIDKQFYYVKNT